MSFVDLFSGQQFYPSWHCPEQRRRGRDISHVCVSLCVCVFVHVLPVSGRTTPYDVRSAATRWLIFDPLPSPCVRGIRQWPNRSSTAKILQDHTPKPQNYSWFLLFLSGIVIHHTTCVSAHLSDSSDITQHREKPSWQQQPGSFPQSMITFPTLVPKCKWVLSLFLVHTGGKNFLRISRGLDEHQRNTN